MNTSTFPVDQSKKWTVVLRRFVRRGGLLVEVRARWRGGCRTLREAVEAAL